MSLTDINIVCFITYMITFGFICAVYYTHAAYEKSNQELKGLASTTNSKLLTLRNCMENIQNECTNCYQEVNSMKEALVLAENTQSFANMNVAEMKNVC